jgi:hypothetical protein
VLRSGAHHLNLATIALKTIQSTRGRALLVRPDGTIYIGRNYAIYSTRDHGRSWQHVTTMPRSLTRRAAECSRLASRLLRHEVKALLTLSDGSHVAANREWVYFSPPGAPGMTRSRVETGSPPLAPPMCMTLGPGDRILWGEYNSKTAHGNPVRLFVSEDRGRSYSIARVFEGGSILHVHNLIHDPAHNCYWLLAGDHGDEPGIGRLSEDLKHFDWIAKGQQSYRAVNAFDFGDRLIYAIDSDREQNALMIMDKKTGRFERGREFEGSCIYSCRFGEWYAIATSVEPSNVNKSRDATLWLSRDGMDWHEALRVSKDRWHPVYFQFGSIVLPRGESDDNTIIYSGQALQGIDNRLIIAKTEQQA